VLLPEMEREAELAVWWRAACKGFGLYYLTKTAEERAEVIKRCCQDMPLLPADTRKAKGETMNLTDILVPELNVESLQANDGKALLLLLVRRLAATDLHLADDLAMLRALYSGGQLPDLSGGQLTPLDTPHVDPKDPEGNVRALGAGCSEEKRKQTVLELADGRLVHAGVWLACQVRRSGFADFIGALRECYDTDMGIAALKPPSSTSRA